MPTIEPYKISVAVDGTDLPEYDPPRDERVDEDEGPGEKSTVYIEAMEGSNFEIRFQAHGPIPFATGQLGVSVCLDSVLAKSKLVSEKYHRRHNRTSLHITSSKFLQGETWVERPFVFNNLTTTDTETSITDVKRIARSIGTIRVRLEKMSTPTEAVPTRGTKDQIQDIPEKVLKGQPIDLSAGFGAPRPTRLPSRWKSKPVGDPLLECVFKYRSRKALQMLDLIPSTPDLDPVVPLHDRDPQTLNLNEARELLSQLQAQGSQPKAVVKQENAGIKQEQDLRRALMFGSSRTNDRKRDITSVAVDKDEIIFVEAKRAKGISIARD